jgi:flavin reductase (DIM6/NTAB) family NADH-FMN oxidoreductase RutF
MSRFPFTRVARQQFRRYFQPSRILIGLFPADTASGVNPITLCFGMHCSYRPPMMAVAIHSRSASYQLIDSTQEFVLVVPGPSLLQETIACGTTSMKDQDKVSTLSLRLCKSTTVAVPSLADAIANVELSKYSIFKTGDHKLLVGRVLAFCVNETLNEPPLISIGPNLSGYTMLLKRGIHRVGIAGAPESGGLTTA